jgi:hypothetical protein
VRSGQQLERECPGQRLEISAVRRGDPSQGQRFGDRDDRRVGEAQLQRGKLPLASGRTRVCVGRHTSLPLLRVGPRATKPFGYKHLRSPGAEWLAACHPQRARRLRVSITTESARFWRIYALFWLLLLVGGGAGIVASAQFEPRAPDLDAQEAPEPCSSTRYLAARD